MPGIFDGAIFDPEIFDVDAPAPPLQIGGIGGAVQVISAFEERRLYVDTWARPGRILVRARIRRLLALASASVEARSLFGGRARLHDLVRADADSEADSGRVGILGTTRDRVAAIVTSRERPQIRSVARATGEPDDDERWVIGVPPDN